MNQEILIFGALLVLIAGVSVYAWWHRKDSGDHTRIAAEQLRHARAMALQHRAAAEEHGTMADMYTARVARLEMPSDTKFMELIK